MLLFDILDNCVAAKEVMHFSVRGFGCALFYFKELRIFINILKGGFYK